MLFELLSFGYHIIWDDDDYDSSDDDDNDSSSTSSITTKEFADIDVLDHMTEQPTSCPSTSSEDVEMSHICAECRSKWLIARKFRQLGNMLLNLRKDIAVYYSPSDTSAAAFAKECFEKSLLILTGDVESKLGGTANERIIRTETPFKPTTQQSMSSQTLSEQKCLTVLSECPTVCHSPDDREHITKTSAFKTDQNQLETSNTLRHTVNINVELSNVGTCTCPCEYTGLRIIQKEGHQS